jgi:hypothetical protein
VSYCLAIISPGKRQPCGCIVNQNGSLNGLDSQKHQQIQREVFLFVAHGTVLAKAEVKLAQQQKSQLFRLLRFD